MEVGDRDQVIKNYLDKLPPEIPASEFSKKDIFYNKENFVFYKNEDIGNHYEILDLLGEGSFGTVFKGVHKITGEERAFKVIPRSKIKKADRFINEINTLKKLDHPNVIRLHEVYESETDIILVQEL